MVTKTQARRKQDIKSKLMAAIAMLLVSSIMMVSSTYAWFTLSTAPEVTGISTAVGANGNLEMALLPTNVSFEAENFGIQSQAGDSMLDLVLRNNTWGNLVELSNEDFTDPYGLKNIVLYPSAINMSTAERINTTSFLSTPKYGADGRVSMLAGDTVTSTYDSGAKVFNVNTNYGVRAVGNASGMTDRQLSYRNAMANAATAFAQAKNEATSSLNSRGPAVATIAINHAANASATHSKTDVENLLAIVSDMERAVEYIEKGYMQYILAFAASSLNNQEAEGSDLIWTNVKALVENPDNDLSDVVAAIPAGLDIAAIKTINTEVTETKQNIAGAKGRLEALKTGEKDNFTWDELSTAMAGLVDPNEILVNGYTVDQVKENITALLSGVTVTVPTGGGVYADIADHCGNYSANIKLNDDAAYGGLSLAGLEAVMNTKTRENPIHSEVVKTIVNNKAPSGDTTAAMPISEFYGYIIDLAFRTNATESNLLLQVEPEDRIYSDNTNNETMGNGSTMTFQSTSNTFTTEKVKDLMENIRLVFFDPENGNVYTYGRLDMDNGVSIGADGVTAYIRTCAANGTEISYKLVEANAQYDDKNKYFTLEESYEQEFVNANTFAGLKDSLYVVNEENTTVEVAADAEYDAGETYYKKVETWEPWSVTNQEQQSAEFNAAIVTGLYIQESKTTGGVGAFIDSNIITSLPQGTPKAVSVLVYLDGNTITNADVAADVASSMTGSMNIQFASSANLVPMEYAALHQSDGISSVATEDYEITIDASKAEGAIARGTVSGNTYTFSLAGLKEGYTYTVKVGESELSADESGNYTYTATANATIKITATATVTGG